MLKYQTLIDTLIKFLLAVWFCNVENAIWKKTLRTICYHSASSNGPHLYANLTWLLIFSQYSHLHVLIPLLPASAPLHSLITPSDSAICFHYALPFTLAFIVYFLGFTLTCPRSSRLPHLLSFAMPMYLFSLTEPAHRCSHSYLENKKKLIVSFYAICWTMLYLLFRFFNLKNGKRQRRVNQLLT